MQKLLIAAIVVASIAGVAIAGPSKSNIVPISFESVEEYANELFDRYDHDGNGAITRAEIEAYYAEQE